MNLFDFEDPVLNERNNNTPVYVNRYVARSLIDVAGLKNKDPQALAEYFLQVGINSVKHCKDQKVKFDIENGTTETIHHERESYTEMVRDLRGGTQVYPIGDGKRITFTHEVDLTRDTFSRKDGHYNHRIVVWDEDWNLIHKTRDFHFMGTQIDPTTGYEYNIEFATGMTFLDGNIIIAFGYQDNGTFLLKMPEDVFFDFVSRG